MTSRDRRMHVALALLSCLFLVVEAGGVLGPLVLYVAPLVLLALPLVAGRYLGEETIARLVAARRRAPRRRRIGDLPARRVRRPFPRVSRGGRLIAESLAVRPPPALALS